MPVTRVLAVAVVMITTFVGTLAGCGRPLPTTQTSSTAPTSTASSPSAGSATASPTPSATRTPSARTPSPVLVPAPTGAPPDAAKVTARVNRTRVKDALGGYSAAVVDVGTGATLFRHQADRVRIPASTLKLVTGAAALSALGPDHTFRTTVVSPKAGEIVLVGGGDPYLTAKPVAGIFPRRASVADLAKSTAAALAKSRIKTVRLGYDARLFAGPAWNPAWPTGYSDQVTPVSALWVDEGRVAGRSTGPRAKDPARDAATKFAAALHKKGVRVTGLASTRAPRGAAEIAAVASAPLDRTVEQMLMVSDNDAAEVLLRHVALAAGRPGSATEGAKAVQVALREMGALTGGTRILDGSGLARENRVSAATLVRILRLAAHERVELRALVTGLPVAGVEGSLRVRFGDNASLAGRGVVRGKTGTLREVQTLAGLIRTRDGSVLVYAFLNNRPKNVYNAKVWLDRVTTTLSTCGCR